MSVSVFSIGISNLRLKWISTAWDMIIMVNAPPVVADITLHMGVMRNTGRITTFDSSICRSQCSLSGYQTPSHMYPRFLHTLHSVRWSSWLAAVGMATDFTTDWRLWNIDRDGWLRNRVASHGDNVVISMVIWKLPGNSDGNYQLPR